MKSARCATCGIPTPYAIVAFAVKFPSWEGWTCAKHMDGVVFLPCGEVFKPALLNTYKIHAQIYTIPKLFAILTLMKRFK
jgi:hypothetical protein